MSYINSNHLEKVKQAVEVTKAHYEPGRQDRNHRWVWRTQIYDMFHVEYKTYLGWLRKDLEYMAYMQQVRERQAADEQACTEQRASNARRPGIRGKQKPGKADAHA